MMELSGKQWCSVEVDKHAAELLAEAVGMPISIATILLARGMSAKDEVEGFLNTRLSNLADPFLVHGMRSSVDRIWAGIEASEKIVIYGDYDVDGVTSTVLMVSVLRQMGADVDWFIPNRLTDGYGLLPGPMNKCIETHNPKLIITVDCGTGSVEAVEAATKAGVDVVVTDHHELSGDLAPACAVVNPKLGSNPESRDLAGVAVAFKVCHALLKAGREKGVDSVHNIDIRKWMDLVAIGIVADIVPAVGENRILARYGLLRINSGEACMGVKALMDVAGIKGGVNTYHVGFMIAPRLNAAGRMGAAELGVKLLLTDDADMAGELAVRLDSANNERKRIEDGVRSDAEAEINLYFDSTKCFGLVVGQKGWHAGVIGIVASRLCSRYGRPALVVAIDEDGFGKGSCRSVDGVDIVEVLKACSDDLESFGGHKMAAGVVVKESKLDQFAKHFNSICAAKLTNKDLRPRINVDVWTGLGQIDQDLFAWIKKLEPFGPGNTVPLIGVRNVRVLGDHRIVGKNHLKMVITSGTSQFDCIGFGLGDREIPDGLMDVLFNLEENTFRGHTTLQLNIKDFSPAQNMGM